MEYFKHANTVFRNRVLLYNVTMNNGSDCYDFLLIENEKEWR